MRLDSFEAEMTASGVPRSAVEMKRMQTGGRQFRELLEQSAYRRQILYDQNTWSLIVDYMFQNTIYHQHQRLMELQQITLSSLRSGAIIDRNSEAFRFTISPIPGSELFLRALGYQWNPQNTQMILMSNPWNDQQQIVDVAAGSIQSLCAQHLPIQNRKTTRNSAADRIQSPPIHIPSKITTTTIRQNKSEENVTVFPVDDRYAPKPTQMEHLQSYGIHHFDKILQNGAHDDLLVQKNWEMLIESMCANLTVVSIQEQLNSLRALQSVTLNVLNLRDRNQPMVIHGGAPQFKQSLRGLIGIDSFLRGIGFKININANSTNYKITKYNHDRLQSVITVAQEAIRKRKKMVKLLISLQAAWQKALNSMYRDKELQSQHRTINNLTATDFSTDYNAYYDLFNCAVLLGTTHRTNRNTKRVAIGIMNHFCIKTDGIHSFSRAMLDDLYAVYEIVRQIEEFRGQQYQQMLDCSSHTSSPYIHAASAIHSNMSSFPVSITSGAGGVELAEESSQSYSLSEYSAQRDQLQGLTAQLILEQAMNFGRHWISHMPSTEDICSDNELDAFYQLEPGALDPKLKAKWDAILANDQQFKEYERYIKHMDKIQGACDFDENRCDDEKCGWNIYKKSSRPIMALPPHQVLHVMFFHSVGMLLCFMYIGCSSLSMDCILASHSRFTMDRLQTTSKWKAERSIPPKLSWSTQKIEGQRHEVEQFPSLLKIY